MSGSKSPAPASAPAEETQQNTVNNATTNGHRSPDANAAEPAKVVNGSPKRSIEEDNSSELPDAPPPATNGYPTGATEGDEDANSEAETVLTSPVKKREAERRVEAIKQEKPDQPALPAPSAVKEEHDEEDDEDADAPGSPDDSAVPTSAAPASKATSQDRADGRVERSREHSSEPLSDVSPTRSGSGQSSRASSNSRAQSERPDSSSKNNNKDSPNPRKRKHRASSVNIPNKRPSMDVAKRRLRDLHSEGVATGRSPSPSRRGHRRAVSTQSAIVDGSSDAQGNRKRRAVTQFPVREPKAAKQTWEDSSVSSEATSHGQGEVPRRQRGIGRSTSTPGRPPGREHKRHINKYGFTKLAEACEDGDLELVKEWRHKDPDQLEIEEFAKNTPLQIASLNGNSEVVEYLIGEGCRIDCYNVDKDTPLIDAAENGHADVVDILLNAGVDPLRQNLKGQQALDVVNDDTENATEIRAFLRKAMEKWNSVDARKRREHEEEQRFSSRPSGELHFMARTYENLHKLVVNNDRNSVREFLDARVPVDNNIIAAAAKTGDSYLINMLLAEMTEKKAFQKPEKPLLSVLGTSHLETVKSLTELDQFNPLWRNRQGKSWPEIADERHGPMWKQESELLHRLYNEAQEKAGRRSSSPVTKRDEIKRRPPPQSGDNSDEDSPPKRKNGKRLMSRREMRAASGKPFSDSSSDESSSETAREADESMKPPESPNTKRGPGRPRKKSTSSQAAEPPQEAARTRRRSSSIREKAEATLPIVDEQMEDADATADVNAGEKMEIEDVQPASQATSTPQQIKEKEEAKRKADEDAKKKAEDEAKEAFEAEALRREADARKKEEDESKARKAEEDARKAAEEKRAEEQRQAEAAKLREEEEAKKAESARRAEEQRKKLERELSEAKSKHRQELASSLPGALSRLLSPTLDEPEQSRLAMESLELFTPLQALPFATEDSGSKSRIELFVLNAQAAPLLGNVGLDLLLSHNAPGFEDSLAHEWDSLPLDEADRDCVRAILPGHLLSADPVDTDEDMMDEELSFEAELKRSAHQLHSAYEAQSKLETAEVELRWVKLQDVLDNLHPVLRDTPIDVRTDLRRPQDHARMLKGIQTSNAPDFFGQVNAWWKQSSMQPDVKGGKATAQPVQFSVESTQVRVSHEK
ncbi:hypothetical protein Q7P37_004721 [Cladosporium fusiforme]